MGECKADVVLEELATTVMRMKQSMQKNKVKEVKITARVMTTATKTKMIMTKTTIMIRMMTLTRTTMIMVTAKKYKSVSSCVLPNLVEHVGHGKDDMYVSDSIKDGSLTILQLGRVSFFNSS